MRITSKGAGAVKVVSGQRTLDSMFCPSAGKGVAKASPGQASLFCSVASSDQLKQGIRELQRGKQTDVTTPAPAKSSDFSAADAKRTSGVKSTKKRQRVQHLFH
jgi:hypothetical protein